MAKAKFSPAVQAAYQRRAARAGQAEVNFQWFLKEQSDKIAMSLVERMRITTQHLLGRLVKNISVPVVKIKGPRSGRMQVVERSKPGEFPRADTTQLMKTAFIDVKEISRGVVEGWVGTPLNYGIFLELKMERQFLTRTLREEEETVRQILTGPIA